MSAPDEALVRADVAAHRIFVAGEPLTAAKLQRDVLPSLHRQAAALDARLARARSDLQHSVQIELDAVQRFLDDTSSAPDALPARIAAAQQDLDSLVPLLQPGADVEALEAQLDALHGLYAARGYYRLLSEADELATAALQADSQQSPDHNHKETALRALVDLGALLQRVTAEWSSSSAEGGKEPRIIGYLRAQLVKTYDTLHQARSNALAAALQEAGWPVSTVNEENLTGRKYDPEAVREEELSILLTQQVRDTFFDLCSLQRLGDGSIWPDPDQHLLLTPQASFAEASSLPAGSHEYTPLFPSAVLLQPTLQRFAYHFDTDHPSNRLDKPEWWMRHLMDVMAHQWALWRPQTGVGELYSISGYAGDAHRELLHGILTTARVKLEASIPLLLPHPQLLAHTLFAALEFDHEVTELASDDQFRPTVKLSAVMLENDDCSRAWVAGEKEHALLTLKGLLDAPNAWTIALADGTDDDGTEIPTGTVLTPSGAKAPLPRTTISSRELVELLEHITGLYRPLPSEGKTTLQLRYAFFAQIQRPLITTYLATLQSVLDAFEASSSVFARHIPGAMLGGESKEEGPSSSGRAGTERLASIYISAYYLRSFLALWAGEGFFVELSHDILAANLDGPSSNGPDSGLWAPLIDQVTTLEERAVQAIRRLVVGEVTDATVEYSKRDWIEAHDERSPQEPEADSVPTSSLLPALSTFSTHLSQLTQSMSSPLVLLPLYRTVVRGICDMLLDRVVLVGGTRRFDYTGARRFYLDLQEGWLVVVKDLALRAEETGQHHLLGRRPELAFRTLDHAASLLALAPDPEGVSVVARPRAWPPTTWTVADGIYAAFDMDESGLQALTQQVGDLPPRLVRDVLRRRVECWR